jgi:hypothetical protein
MEIAITILIILGVVLVTALVLGGWLIVAVVRLIGGLFSAGASHASTLPAAGPGRVRCPHPKCRADNPHTARFCRRCGKMLQLPHRAAPHHPVRPQYNSHAA